MYLPGQPVPFTDLRHMLQLHRIFAKSLIGNLNLVVEA